MRLHDLTAGNHLIHSPAVFVADIHIFDEAQDMSAVLKEARQIHKRVVVDAALNNTVDFERTIAGCFRGGYALKHLLHAGTLAAHLSEDRVIQCIEADRQALQACPFQRVNLPRQQVGIGRHGQDRQRPQYHQASRPEARRPGAAGVHRLSDAASPRPSRTMMRVSRAISSNVSNCGLGKN